MKRIIQRVFPRRDAQARADHPETAAVSSELTSSDVEKYYLRIIVDVLKRLLVPVDSVEIGVKRATGITGRPAYAGYVRVLRWEPIMPVLLQNLPVIDARIRKVVEASVILEDTEFTGLWFQAGSTVEGAPGTLVGMPAELLRQPMP